MVTIGILAVAVIWDVRCQRIPNVFSIIGIFAGCILMLLPWSDVDYKSFFLGLTIPFLLGWIPFRMGALGAGDVKLFMVVGCLNSLSHLFSCIVFSFLLAAGISIIKLLILQQTRISLLQVFQYFQTIFIQKQIEKYPGVGQKGHTIYFSIAILLGYVTMLGVNACKIRLF